MLLKALEMALNGRTSIVVAQRGTHEQLMNEEGTYAELYRSRSSERCGFRSCEDFSCEKEKANESQCVEDHYAYNVDRRPACN